MPKTKKNKDKIRKCLDEWNCDYVFVKSQKLHAKKGIQILKGKDFDPNLIFDHETEISLVRPLNFKDPKVYRFNFVGNSLHKSYLIDLEPPFFHNKETNVYDFYEVYCKKRYLGKYWRNEIEVPKEIESKLKEISTYLFEEKQIFAFSIEFIKCEKTNKYVVIDLNLGAYPMYYFDLEYVDKFIEDLYLGIENANDLIERKY